MANHQRFAEARAKKSAAMSEETFPQRHLLPMVGTAVAPAAASATRQNGVSGRGASRAMSLYQSTDLQERVRHADRARVRSRSVDFLHESGQHAALASPLPHDGGRAGGSMSPVSGSLGMSPFKRSPADLFRKEGGGGGGGGDGGGGGMISEFVPMARRLRIREDQEFRLREVSLQ